MINKDALLKLNNSYSYSYMRYQAAILEYQAACINNNPSQIEEAGNKCHDILDIYLDSLYSLLKYNSNPPSELTY